MEEPTCKRQIQEVFGPNLIKPIVCKRQVSDKRVGSVIRKDKVYIRVGI